MIYNLVIHIPGTDGYTNSTRKHADINFFRHALHSMYVYC